MKTPVIRQHNQADCRLACLAMLAGAHGSRRNLSAFVTDVCPPVVPLPLSGPTFRARAREQQVCVRGRQVPWPAGMTLRADIEAQMRSLVEWVFESLFAAGERPFSRR